MDISFGRLSNESIMSSLTIASTKYPSSSEIGNENIAKSALRFFVSTIDFNYPLLHSLKNQKFLIPSIVRKEI